MSNLNNLRHVTSYGANLDLYQDTASAIEYLRFPRLLMGDWDIPHPSHRTLGASTVPNRLYALGILFRDVHFRPHHAWRVYKTPAGVRAFLTSNWGELRESHELYLMDDLQMDANYIRLTRDRGAWWCRVSPKLGREDDFVSWYWTTIKGERAKELPEVLNMLKVHDELCARSFRTRYAAVVYCGCTTTYMEFGYRFQRNDGDCLFCNGKGKRALLISGNEIELARKDPMIWSDLLQDQGATDEVIEGVRMASRVEVEVITPPKEMPHGDRPFTDWSGQQERRVITGV